MGRVSMPLGDSKENPLDECLHTTENNVQTSLQAIDKSQWGVAKDALERHFSGKHEILLEILYIQVYLRRWERVDEILRMIDESLVPEKNLVVSALEGDHESVRKLLEKKELKAKVICASFLVVAAAGTTETVAELFVGVKDTYTPQTYSDALFLAALGQHSEYLYLLLCHPEISSSYHDMARAHRMLELVCLDEAPNRSLINFFDNVMEAKWKPKHWKH
ncbi:hypothetical protein SK128_025635 [Halocaridina rubra]|uniref:Uncharacterized protein n=1 Tax=Halocaridina rubra TaxID=373956 RepID=A0AAN8XRS3_HALRR